MAGKSKKATDDYILTHQHKNPSQHKSPSSARSQTAPTGRSFRSPGGPKSFRSKSVQTPSRSVTARKPSSKKGFGGSLRETPKSQSKKNPYEQIVPVEDSSAFKTYHTMANKQWSGRIASKYQKQKYDSKYMHMTQIVEPEQEAETEVDYTMPIRLVPATKSAKSTKEAYRPYGTGNIKSKKSSVAFMVLAIIGILFWIVAVIMLILYLIIFK